jgi:uridine kinase
MKVIGIAGGSGVGKSTVSYALVDKYPEKYEIINLDDYQKLKSSSDLPTVDEINWDHPDAILWDDLKKDIKALSKGKDVHIQVWAHRSNPDYHLHGKMLPRTLKPKPILIVEGYLALYKDLIKEYDKTFYLELDEESRSKRRRDARGGKDTIIGHDQYVDKVLKPMHRMYVEPTKAKADIIIEVSGKTVDQIAEFINQNI